MDHTIVAISTSLGVGAISIVRLSGNDAIKIVNKIFKGTNLNKVLSHTIHHGYIVDNNKIIDEVLVSVFKAPKTYTKEDVVEINAHGGIATTHAILELCLLNGAKIAEPGEFTKRAFLNGRIDLTEAEAIADLINSGSEESRKLAINQLTGSLYNLITEIRKKLLTLMSEIEVNIDYPEYEDITDMTTNLVNNKLLPIQNDLTTLLEESNNTKIIQDGLNVALIGRPNVGKSSLLNKLLDEDKAIVTDIAGTTRDIVEGSIILQGIKINFVDTAGIRKTADLIESIGVNKSIKELNNADLVILILNNNEKLTKDDEELLKLVKNKPHLIFINKNDLPNKLIINESNTIKGNTKDYKGIKPLKDAIINYFNLDNIKVKDQTYLTNARQKALTKESIACIASAIKALKSNVPVDIVENDIKACYDTLGEIIGATYRDDLLDEMFSHFCLGK
jgi:tRNA modification GTPase